MQNREVLLGITGRDYTIIASSKAAMRGATILKASDDKTRQLSEHSLMAFVGEAGDTTQFAEYIQANIALYTTRNAYTLSPSAIASFTRNELARALRSRNPYTVNLLLGGVDVPPTTTSNTSPQTQTQTAEAQTPNPTPVPSAEVRPKLYWIDYLAACTAVPYAAHGYAQYYCLSILDKHHHPDIDFETGMKLLRMCSEELRRRLPIDFKGLAVKVVDKDGVREVDFVDDRKVTAP